MLASSQRGITQLSLITRERVFFGGHSQPVNGAQSVCAFIADPDREDGRADLTSTELAVKKSLLGIRRQQEDLPNTAFLP